MFVLLELSSVDLWCFGVANLLVCWLLNGWVVGVFDFVSCWNLGFGELFDLCSC